MVFHEQELFLALSCARTICSAQDEGPRTMCNVQNGASQRNAGNKERGGGICRKYKHKKNRVSFGKKTILVQKRKKHQKRFCIWQILMMGPMLD